MCPRVFRRNEGARADRSAASIGSASRRHSQVIAVDPETIRGIAARISAWEKDEVTGVKHVDADQGNAVGTLIKRQDQVSGIGSHGKLRNVFNDF